MADEAKCNYLMSLYVSVFAVQECHQYAVGNSAHLPWLVLGMIVSAKK